MKRKIGKRAALGVPVGIAIGYLITVGISLGWGGGHYSPCVPELITAMGSEIGAVALQTLLCALLGAGFGAISVIWDVERWSIVWRTGIYFLLASAIMLPIAYAARWMEHSLTGFLVYFGIFVVIFVVIWMIQCARARREVKQMNAHLSRGGGSRP